MSDEEKARRHPCVVARDEFRAKFARLHDGAAEGVYLANRLEVAFMAGWNAAERRALAALGHGDEQRSGDGGER